MPESFSGIFCRGAGRLHRPRLGSREPPGYPLSPHFLKPKPDAHKGRHYISPDPSTPSPPGEGLMWGEVRGFLRCRDAPCGHPVPLIENVSGRKSDPCGRPHPTSLTDKHTTVLSVSQYLHLSPVRAGWMAVSMKVAGCSDRAAYLNQAVLSTCLTAP